jgi:hypothetical protein
MVGIEDAMDNKVRKRKEETRNSSRVGLEPVPPKKSIKDQSGIWQCGDWDEIRRGHRACIRATCLAHGREERVVVGAISASKRILDMCSGSTSDG